MGKTALAHRYGYSHELIVIREDSALLNKAEARLERYRALVDLFSGMLNGQERFCPVSEAGRLEFFCRDVGPEIPEIRVVDLEDARLPGAVEQLRQIFIIARKG